MTSTKVGKIALLPRGEWVSTEQYAALDIVTYANDSWVAKESNIGVSPTDGDYWQSLTGGTGKIATEDHAQYLLDTAQAAEDHNISTADHTTATGDHTQATDDHTQASSDSSRASTDHTNSEKATESATKATSEASNVNATISGTVLTITDRTGKSTSVDTKGETGEVSEQELTEAVNDIKSKVRAIASVVDETLTINFNIE